MKNKIAQALEIVDVLVTTGSVSMGDRDMLKPILQKYFAATIHFGSFSLLLSFINIDMSRVTFPRELDYIHCFRSRKHETGEADDICYLLHPSVRRQEKVFLVSTGKSGIRYRHCAFISFAPSERNVR